MKLQDTLRRRDSYRLLLLLIASISFSYSDAQECHRRCGKQLHNHVNLKASALRSDTIDLLHASLFLDFTKQNEELLSAVCTHELVSLMDSVTVLNFDLLGLTVDSVKSQNEPLPYVHVGELLSIFPPLPLSEGDSVSLTIYYHGHPQMDASGWGGFYFQGNYAFNLGVGFYADPHSFGRVWFPCFDNFVERQTMDFSVLTNLGRTSYCNGDLISTETVGQDSLLSHWFMSDPIPSYLASVAVGEYLHLENFYESITGNDIPIWLTARQQDMNNVANSFVNLGDCMGVFEDRFGPYVWQRVGFVFVPFSSGAMEHATNISYPLAAANGTLQFEKLMAHELAHHWWGDLITCRTEADMWINEGWASYCESLFLEGKYGHTQFRNSVRTNHGNVINRAHLNDGARLPVSGIGHEHTYGDHVYKKGADVAHSLRGYMGDEAFFEAATAFMNEYAFKDVTSEILKDFFQQYTSSNLTAFFDDRVYQPGYAAFLVHHLEPETVGDGYDVKLTFQQRQHYTAEPYHDVPYTVRLWDTNGNYSDHEMQLSLWETETTVFDSFIPHVVEIDPHGRINDAVLSDWVSVNSNGITILNHSDMRLTVSNLAQNDSVWLLIENYRVCPDFVPFTGEYRISDDRFWRIQGLIPEDANVTVRLDFRGNPNQANYFDPLFFDYVSSLGYPEDSLVLLHRFNSQEPWALVEDFVVNPMGSNTNMNGRIEFQIKKPGDYVWAIRDNTIDADIASGAESVVLLFPNPARDRVFVPNILNEEYVIIDMAGREVLSGRTNGGMIPVGQLNSGNYLVRINTNPTVLTYKIRKE